MMMGIPIPQKNSRREVSPVGNRRRNGRTQKPAPKRKASVFEIVAAISAAGSFILQLILTIQDWLRK